MMKLTVSRNGITEKGRELPVGYAVFYIGHIIGGMVKIKFGDGSIDVAHPACFRELK